MPAVEQKLDTVTVQLRENVVTTWQGKCKGAAQIHAAYLKKQQTSFQREMLFLLLVDMLSRSCVVNGAMLTEGNRYFKRRLRIVIFFLTVSNLEYVRIKINLLISCNSERLAGANSR